MGYPGNKGRLVTSKRIDNAVVKLDDIVLDP